MMDIMEKYGHGMTMIDIDENTPSIQQFMDGFVDNVSNYVNIDFEDDNLDTLRAKLQDDGKLWSGLLADSGGNLELTKCFFYILSWHWDRFRNPSPQTIQQQNCTQTTINLSSDENTPQLISQRDILESHKTLGAYKTICGDETDHINYLLGKSDDLISLLGTGQLNRRQARIAYNSNYIPAMLYSIPAMGINESALYKVTQKAVARFLQILGIEKNFPRAAAFAPIKYGGIGLKHVYTESVLNKIESLMNHVNDRINLGRTMRRIINFTQMLAGTYTPLLECHKDITHIKNNWFMTIRDFIMKIETTIKLKYIWKPKLIRRYEYSLMDKILTKQLTPRELTTANNWRVYFRVNTIAQISNNAGNKILPEYFERSKVHLHKSKATVKWPNQQRPHLDTFRIWKKVLIMITNCSPTGGISDLI
jgi:hypothetical protein